MMQQAKQEIYIESIVRPGAIERGSSRLEPFKASTDQLEAIRSHSPDSELDLPRRGASQQAVNMAEHTLTPSLPDVGQSVGNSKLAGAQQESGLATSEKVRCARLRSLHCRSSLVPLLIVNFG